jgi:4,5-dihydroxyphthalate decarboxylase
MVPLAWVRKAVEEQKELLGLDPWSYGLSAANRKNLETVQRYCHEQGLIKAMQPLDALFADTDLGDAAGSNEF